MKVNDRLLLGILLAAAGFFVLAYGLRLLATVLQIRRLRFRPRNYVRIEREALSEAERLILATPERTLGELGFQYQQTWQVTAMAELDEAATSCFELYRHAESGCVAQVAPSDQPEPGLLANCIFISRVGEKRWMTMNRHLHQHFHYPPECVVADAMADSLAAQWAFHRQRADLPASCDASEAEEFDHDTQEARLFACWEKSGLLCREGDYWCLSQRGAWRFLRQVLAGNQCVARLPPMLVSESPEMRVLADTLAWRNQERLLRAMAAPLREKYRWFAVSSLLGMATFAWMTSWQTACLLMLVLLFHEFGHALAMRWLGYRQLGVVVLPFLGALALGRKDDAGPWQRLLVLLAGPLPGLLLGIALAQFASGAVDRPQWQLELVTMLIVVNLFNLIPLTPLDGGQIVETFLFARRPRLRFGFFAASTLGLILVGYHLESPYLAGAGFLLAVGIPHAWRAMGLLGGLPMAATVDASLQAIFTRLHSLGQAGLNFTLRMQQVRGLLPKMLGRAPRLHESLAGLAIYLLVLALPVAALLTMPGYAASIGKLVSGASTERHRAPQPPDWPAELAAAKTPLQRWEVLYRAGEWFEEAEQDEAAQARYREALAELPADDPESRLPRLDTRIALARLDEDTEAARQAYLALLPELRTLDGGARERLANVLEALSWLVTPASEERLAYLQEAVSEREKHAFQEIDYSLAHDRTQLARLLDARGEEAAAADLLHGNLPPHPAGLTIHREAHAWFHMAHARPEVALATPGLVTAPGSARLWALQATGKLDLALAELEQKLADLKRKQRVSPWAQIEAVLDLAVLSASTAERPEQAARWLNELASLRTQEKNIFRYLRQRVREEAQGSEWEAMRGRSRLNLLDRLPGAEEDIREDHANSGQCRTSSPSASGA